MTIIEVLLTVTPAWCMIWIVTNLICWKQTGHQWNWRAIVWPPLYFRWLRR